MATPPRFVSVKNYKTFQHYGTRNPPWIKFYKTFLSDYELRQLPIPSRFLLSCCYLLASERENMIPYDLGYLSERIGMKVTETILTPLFTSGHLLASSASVLLASDSSLLSSSLSSSEGEKIVKKRGNGHRPFPEDFQIEDKHKVLASQWKLDVGYEFGKFKNYCLAHDKRYSDYTAAFRNWLSNAYERKGAKP